MTLAPESRLGSYVILTLLGAGGMGEVYRARDPQLGRDVAIKVLPASISTDPERLKRFEQEARAAAALNHPNILAVFQLGISEGVPYIVSELLEGATLRELTRSGPLPTRKSIDYGTQIARGLAAAHEKGIVHRDLKPENLFVTNDGRVKILDFGLAKLLQPSPLPANEVPTVSAGTEPGLVLGTVGYMAPEQVRGEAAGHRADIFAFGAVLYEMLAGQRAFRKPTCAETMSAILNEYPPEIALSTASVPPTLVKIVHRCLEKIPEQRFQSASDLAFALGALSDSGSAPAAVQQDGSGRTRRGKALRYGAIAIIAAVVLGIAVWFTPAPVSASLDSTQITFSAKPKEAPLFTDGSRLYFTSRGEPSQMAVSGGFIAPMRILELGMQLQDISSDGSKVLALSPKPGDEIGRGALWLATTLGGAHES